MLLMEGFGGREDLLSIHDYREDKPKLYTQMNIPLLIPLFTVTFLLGTGAFMTALRQPKHSMLLQVPVSMEQLMRVTRARETGINLPRGTPEAELQMGIMRVEVLGEPAQMFSVNAKSADPYDDNIPWV